jgi:uncharacterized protein YgiB involved in biofilm formation
MKRSLTVSLVLLGSAAAGLPGCKPNAESYPSVAACEQSGKHTDQECVDAFAAAQREHEATAPHFPTREACIATYGEDGCEERHNVAGASFFMPLMLGYMMGRGVNYHPLYEGSHRRDCMVASNGSNFGNCGNSGGGGGGSGGGWFRRTFGGGSSGGDDGGTVSRGGFGGAGHGSAGGE